MTTTIENAPPTLNAFSPEGNTTLKTGKTGKWRYQPTVIKFDPEIHHSIDEPEWTKKLSDFGYKDVDGLSEIGATAPFQLFTDEAIRLMRQDVLSEPIQENCVFSNPRSPYVIRGYAPRYSQFIYDAWMHPETTKAVSSAAKVDLVPVFDYEIGHVNIQLGKKGIDGVQDLSEVPMPPLAASERIEPSKYDDKPVFAWHYDDEPFVAVLMLSDTTGMDGGETAVSCADGTIEKIPGPGLGKVVVMQGSMLKHVALRARNCNERITMVTSYRPRDPLKEDTTVMTQTVESSDLSIMGSQWLEYRLNVLGERCNIMAKKFATGFTRAEVEKFCKDQESWLRTTAYEPFQRDLVK